MASKVIHSVNGKIRGVWYETSSGRRTYLANRSAKQIHRARNAWCIDLATLEKCREEGIRTVGVIRRDGGKRLVWLTLVSDFFDSPHSFSYLSDARQRGLPLSRFRIDPTKCAKAIERACKLR